MPIKLNSDICPDIPDEILEISRQITERKLLEQKAQKKRERCQKISKWFFANIVGIIAIITAIILSR